MSSSNCCFLTCIQISQEAGQVVWYSHLSKNVLQFVVIHTVKGFGIVDIFWNFFAFLMIQQILEIWSGSFAFSKSSLNIYRINKLERYQALILLKNEQIGRLWCREIWSVEVLDADEGDKKGVEDVYYIWQFWICSQAILKHEDFYNNVLFLAVFSLDFFLSFLVSANLIYLTILFPSTSSGFIYCMGTVFNYFLFKQ